VSAALFPSDGHEGGIKFTFLSLVCKWPPVPCESSVFPLLVSASKLPPFFFFFNKDSSHMGLGTCPSQVQPPPNLTLSSNKIMSWETGLVLQQ
jgi:hypothetical protein